MNDYIISILSLPSRLGRQKERWKETNGENNTVRLYRNLVDHYIVVCLQK